LIGLKKSNKDNKDGPSMCIAFAEMIDKAEKDYLCVVIFFVVTMTEVVRLAANS